MELKDYLEIGVQKAGSLTALGKILDMSQPRMSHCKAHKERLPTDAAVRLADYINIDLRAIIAANELATEKKEEKRNFWRPFVEHARAAIMAIVVTFFSVTNFLTPTPAEAAPVIKDYGDTLYYVKFYGCSDRQTHLRRVSSPSHFRILVFQVRQITTEQSISQH